MVLTFCNGSMQVLLGLEAFGSPFAAAAGRQLVVPLATKILHLIAIASPALMFAGLAVAWHLNNECRSIASQGFQPIGVPSDASPLAEVSDLPRDSPALPAALPP